MLGRTHLSLAGTLGRYLLAIIHAQVTAAGDKYMLLPSCFEVLSTIFLLFRSYGRSPRQCTAQRAFKAEEDARLRGMCKNIRRPIPTPTSFKDTRGECRCIVRLYITQASSTDTNYRYRKYDCPVRGCSYKNLQKFNVQIHYNAVQ